MNPSNFDESNAVLGPPHGIPESAPGCGGVGSLNVYRGPDADGDQVVVSCWAPSNADIETLKRGGRIWIAISGDSMPPISMQTTSPFSETP